MRRLLEGVHFFQNIGFERHRDLFSRLKDGQNPEACFLTCSDSRIVPSLITNSDPGQLFVIRNVGNIVPCHGTSNNGEMAAIEFAVAALDVKDIIVCGHTQCGAMKSLLSNEPLDRMPNVRDWLKHAEATKQIVSEHYSNLANDELLNATAQENVLVQLEHLRTLPMLAARLARNQIHLHGWVYKIETGEVFRYDSQAQQFLKFGLTVDDSGESQPPENPLTRKNAIAEVA